MKLGKIVSLHVEVIVTFQLLLRHLLIYLNILEQKRLLFHLKSNIVFERILAKFKLLLDFWILQMTSVGM